LYCELPVREVRMRRLLVIGGGLSLAAILGSCARVSGVADSGTTGGYGGAEADGGVDASVDGVDASVDGDCAPDKGYKNIAYSSCCNNEPCHGQCVSTPQGESCQCLGIDGGCSGGLMCCHGWVFGCANVTSCVPAH
jgi:hypothetical protein